MDMTSDQTRIWKNQDRIPYHIRQFEEPYRSTVHLGRFIQSLVPTPTGDALDVACGAGANIFYLSQLFPHYRWAGVDIAGDVLFSIGRQQFRDRGCAVTLIEGDLYKLTDVFPDRRFDLVLSIQTLLGLPEYEEAMDQLLAVTRGWLFVTSLFTDFDVDAKIQAMDYACESRGCQQFVSQDFDIDIDLPRPQKYGLTTYTQTLIDGRRLQFTGPLLQPWKFVGIRMGDQ
jgi:SAM-dependent methyltransferase